MRFWRHGCKIEEICYNIDMERRIGRLVLERGRWNIAENIYDVHELEQAKRRNRKVYITDIAIDKVPYIKYDGFTEERNKIMQEFISFIQDYKKRKEMKE